MRGVSAISKGKAEREQESIEKKASVRSEGLGVLMQSFLPN